jgi:hypothetical protein
MFPGRQVDRESEIVDNERDGALDQNRKLQIQLNEVCKTEVAVPVG